MVPSEEVKISPHKFICYARMRILLGVVSDCEELVGGFTGDDGVGLSRYVIPCMPYGRRPIIGIGTVVQSR